MTPAAVPRGDAAHNTRVWQHRTAPDVAGLRVTVLASFTASPLVPHLGAPLHEAGTAPDVRLGPFNQIAQECLRDDSATARSRPDVLVVCARPEDGPATGATTGEDGQEATGPGAGGAEALEGLARLALDGARRWGALLAWVLPPLPDTATRGVGRGGDPRGDVARAVAARERVRARLAPEPDACVVDLEETVRFVGARQAHHPALFRLARVPFTEEVFFRLGGELARVLLSRFGQGCHGVVVDIDTFLDPVRRPRSRSTEEPPQRGTPGRAEAPTEAEELARVLRELPVGRQVAFRTAYPAAWARETLGALAPRLAELPAEWLDSGRGLAADLEAFAARRNVTPDTVAVLTAPSHARVDGARVQGAPADGTPAEGTPVDGIPTDRALAGGAPRGGGTEGRTASGGPGALWRFVEYAGSAEEARQGLLHAGAFDLAPPRSAPTQDGPPYTGGAPHGAHMANAAHVAETAGGAGVRGADGGSGDGTTTADYEAFLRSLRVSVEVIDHDGADVSVEEDVAARAHDFTLALPHSPARFAPAPSASARVDPTRATPDRSGAASRLLSARVRDRYGEYGTTGVVGVRAERHVWHVELFSLSCVVMGKGVEDHVLRALLDRASREGVTELAFHYRATGRNRPAVDFVDAAAERHGTPGETTPVRVTAVERPHESDAGPDAGAAAPGGSDD